ncbi:LOW QUALITY PROTEIN: TRAP-type C4-dicarboxylate transport system, large permease component [Bacillus sp. JCM 19045]|nr:LOW QUALITY PROTEIN: TRAP-type C4-dicarboxylate transport system, large permease component [Bacillus sp. JCM 19045]
MELALQAALILFIVIAVLLVIGVPISISVGFGSVIALISIIGFNEGLILSAQRMFTGMNSFTLLAIPFFVLAGVIMNNGGMALRLINLAKVISAACPDHLPHTNVVANMLFGSISGSAVASAAAVGQTMGPLQEKEGYKREFSAAVNIGSAPAGMIIPPSNTLIVYSLASGGTSIAALFIAGYLPGILWGLACMAVIFFMARRKQMPRSERVTLKQAGIILAKAIPSLLLIVIVIGGIVGGVFTATEGSAIAVIYSLLLSLSMRTIQFKHMPDILLTATRTTVIVLFLIGVSMVMSWVMAFTNIPALLASSLFGFTDNIIIILLIMNLVLLLIGTFLDPTPAILIFTPIFWPIAQSYGIDPIHFGIMIVFNLSIGTITPPMGPVLFIGSRVAGLKLEQVIKPLMPFFIVTVLVLLLVTFVPQITLIVPELLGLFN